MKKIVLYFFLLVLTAQAQTEYVEVDNPVYDFLERMETLQLIEGYNSFLLPKTRGEVAGYLSYVIQKEETLSNVDMQILNDLKTEFEYEIYGTLRNSASLTQSADYLQKDKQRYLYMTAAEGMGTVFINLTAEARALYLKYTNFNTASSRAAAGIVGGEVRGTIAEKFGYKIKATNGALFGDKAAGYGLNRLRSNFKFNEKPDEKFFDETEGYLTADFDLVKFKFGRDRLLLGYGKLKPLITGNAPLFDYVQMGIDYDIINFSFFHGKLLGSKTVTNLPEAGSDVYIEEKYAAYHRLGFNINKHIDFGVGEVIIYGGRPADFSYLNPFNFYKSAEHANSDRDNAMLFLDLNNNSIRSLKISALLLLDDISFSKLGTGWWGNQSMLNLSALLSEPVMELPVDIRIEYLKIDPYVFSHRLQRNNYSHNGFGLNDPYEPNSSISFIGFDYRVNNRFKFSSGFRYTVHGANSESSGTIKNVGGSMLLGHRLSDSEKAGFLDGDKEYLRRWEASLIYEPWNEVYLRADLEYSYNSNRLSNVQGTFFSSLYLSMKL